MNDLIITISREFGCGGRLIGEKLGLELGIPFYDKHIIQLASEKSGLTSAYIDKAEERASNSFLFNLVSSSYSAPAASAVFTQYDLPMNNKAYYAQAAAIRELAEKGSCVILGRCADFVLRDWPNVFTVFIHADIEDRVKRISQEYNMPEMGMVSKVRKIDKGRANYYKHFTGGTWGKANARDLSINTSRCGIDGAVATIKTMLKAGNLI